MARRPPRAPRLPAIPYDDLLAREDRAWTARLLARLTERSASEDDRDAAADTLRQLGDPRAVPPLRALLEDRTAPEPLRDAAGGALLDTLEFSADTLRAWWDSGDPVLQRHALLRMDTRFEELVTAVASDPSHPLYGEAVDTLKIGFEAPRFQSFKLAALRHPDAEIREIAAEGLKWDEPLLAEEPLCAALADPSQEVAVAAALTLGYYESRRALTALAPLRSSKRVHLREAAEESYESLRPAFLLALQQAPSLRAWMEPVWSVLAPSPEELAPEESEAVLPPRSMPARETKTVEQVRACYDEADGAWREKKALFQRIEWTAFTPEERIVLAEYLATHPDPWVREAGCGPLSLWSARDRLLALVDDSNVVVSKAAIYWLGQLAERPDPVVAARAWRRLDEGGVTGTRAYEALRTYATHAPQAEAVPRLQERVRSDEREGVRLEAITALVELGARDAVSALLDLLRAPPALTWALHVALLEACAKLQLAPPADALPALREGDSLSLQLALARLTPAAG